MNDSEMTNILRNFASASSGNTTVTNHVTGKTTTNSAAVEKNAMKALLEGLDAAQRSVNQMPGTHKMAKATNTKHPAKGYLVGGEDGEPESGDVVAEEYKNKYSVGDQVNTPLGKGTITQDLGQAADDRWSDQFFMVNVNGKEIKMGSFEIKGHVEEDTVTKKSSSAMGDLLRAAGSQASGSLGDIFKALGDREEEEKRNSEREFHKGIQKEKELKKGQNGKYELGEAEFGNTIASFKSMAEDMHRLLSEGKEITLTAKEKKPAGRLADSIVEYKLNWQEPGVTEASISKKVKRATKGWGQDKLQTNRVTEAAGSATTPEQDKTIARLKKAGGRIEGEFTNDKGEIAISGINGKRWFAIYPDGSYYRGNTPIPYKFSDNGIWYREGSVAKPAAKAKKERVNHEILANYISDAVSMSVPDGDPIDYLMDKGIIRRIEAIGLDPISELDKAVKKYLDAKDYNSYLADMWDSYASTQGDAGEQNPWR